MSRTNCDALWSVTPSDIPHIKKALNILLGDVAGASLRLEIFARLSGFRTYAGLKTRMESFSDVNGNPFPLRLSEQAVSDGTFYGALDPAVLRRLSYLEETGFMRLMIAALVQARHPILGDIGVPDDATIASLEDTANRIFNITALPKLFENDSKMKHVAMVLTPRNTQPSYSGGAYSIFLLSCSSSDDIPMSPTGSSFELTDDPARVAELISNRLVYAYSTEDLFEIKSFVAETETEKPKDYRQLKDMSAHLLDVSCELDFHAMADAFELDLDDDLDVDTPIEQQCMEWLLVMFMAAEAYQEMKVDQVAGALQ